MSGTQKANAPSLPAADNIYSHYTKAAGLIYLSGQIGQNEKKEVVPGGVTAECAQCIKNIGIVLEAAGATYEHLVKVNIFLKRMEDFDAINEVYEKMLPTPKPSRTCVQAGKLPRM
ncbi:hypothetical protein EMMF5_000377 [Cystobasidiomycetes sp. EMM_F5]